VAAVRRVDADRVLLVARVRERSSQFGDNRLDRLCPPLGGGVDDVAEELGGEEPGERPFDLTVLADVEGAGVVADEEAVEHRDRHALADTARHGLGDHVDPLLGSRGRRAAAVGRSADRLVAEEGDGVGGAELLRGVGGVVGERPAVLLDVEAELPAAVVGLGGGR
jgi:hypothetical protein